MEVYIGRKPGTRDEGMLLQSHNKNALLCHTVLCMLHRDVYVVLGSRARHCIMLLGRVGGTPLRTTSLSVASSPQGAVLGSTPQLEGQSSAGKG